MRVMSDNIQNLHTEGYIGVYVSELEYQPTDYQPEASAMAMIKWAAEAFRSRPVEIQITFDRATGYSFEWPQGC